MINREFSRILKPFFFIKNSICTPSVPKGKSTKVRSCNIFNIKKRACELESSLFIFVANLEPRSKVSICTNK